MDIHRQIEALSQLAAQFPGSSVEPMTVRVVGWPSDDSDPSPGEARVSSVRSAPANFVTVEAPEGCDQMDLTPDQARKLAHALLRKAAEADRATPLPGGGA